MQWCPQLSPVGNWPRERNWRSLPSSRVSSWSLSSSSITACTSCRVKTWRTTQLRSCPKYSCAARTSLGYRLGPTPDWLSSCLPSGSSLAYWLSPTPRHPMVIQSTSMVSTLLDLYLFKRRLRLGQRQLVLRTRQYLSIKLWQPRHNWLRLLTMKKPLKVKETLPAHLVKIFLQFDEYTYYLVL